MRTLALLVLLLLPTVGEGTTRDVPVATHRGQAMAPAVLLAMADPAPVKLPPPPPPRKPDAQQESRPTPPAVSDSKDAAPKAKETAADSKDAAPKAKDTAADEMPAVPFLPPPPPVTGSKEAAPKAKEAPAKDSPAVPFLPPPPPVTGSKEAAPKAKEASAKDMPAAPFLPPPPPVTGSKEAAPKVKEAPAPGPATTEAAKPAVSKPPAMPPLKGSHMAVEKNNCLQCHTEPNLWDEKSRRMYIAKEDVAEDVHAQRGVNCVDCHGGNPEAQDAKEVPHAAEDGFRKDPVEIRKYCVHCHQQQAIELRTSMHGKAGKLEDIAPLSKEGDSGSAGTDKSRPAGAIGVSTLPGEKGDRTLPMPLDCAKCHGKLAHHLLSVKDNRSPVYLDHQVETCGECHAKDRETYRLSVHGLGLYKLGLKITAVCADCHGAHGIYLPLNKQSTLSATRAADTCGKCHRFIEERLQKSVHGRGAGPGGLAEREAPGGEGKRKPTCTDCHQRHEIADPEAARFRRELPNLCGNCHLKLSSRYAMTIHGELTELGYAPAAKCSDCHGAHEIFEVLDPRSTLSPENRAQTCGHCHPNAAGNFLRFDPHLDPAQSRLVHGVYVVLLTLLMSVFGFFGLHSLLWFIRSLVDVLRHGRPHRLQPGRVAYVRFSYRHRVGHFILHWTFLGLAATGLPLKYSHTQWAQRLARAMGGFDSTHFWHMVFALVMTGCLASYLVYLLRRYISGRRQGIPRRRLFFGPDSLIPTWRDVRDFFRMLRWFVGLGPKPTFERWTYWEKFDFWGAVGDAVIIGTTGLIMWFPNAFCAFLPAVTLNVAKTIHSTQALLATGFVFAIHFFNTHLRAEKFPVDASVLTGLVTEAELQEERPEYYERLRREGRLDELRAEVPPRGRLWLIKLFGFVALAIGLALLCGIIIAGMGE